MRHPRRHLATFALALLLILTSVFMLERDRAGLVIRDFSVGVTPVTLYEQPGATGPAVVIAHGFAGSRQIMQAYSLRLAQAGYRVLAFDCEGHGRNPQPMRGDVTKIDGTTVFLVAEVRRVIAAARALPGVTGVSLLGHSMATDILVRAANQEAATGHPVDAVVAISMFSQAVTATEPPRLLVISGEWEGGLRGFALNYVHQVDPTKGEGELATAGPVERMAVVAPHVEHVGVLYSPTAVKAARDWLDAIYHRVSGGDVSSMGVWILVLLIGIVLAVHPLAVLQPKRADPASVPVGRFLLASILPAVIVPVVLTRFRIDFLPVLVADYLMVHLACYGVLQITLLRGWRSLRDGLSITPVVLFLIWGLGAFGIALDRYAASYWPSPERLVLIAVLALGTVPALIADAQLTEAGHAKLWRRVVGRFFLFGSFALAAALDFDRLMFLLIALPLLLLFFSVHGLMGRWIARRSGATVAGLGLGLCLAWVLGVCFPLFSP
ncbi:alpha/beta hydrolase [Rhodobacter capsulatus]|uniref:alpha/beta hydrolase n=1 Tax=Rhodobacter capsulatus TaxID=1061 RepID=UPI00402679B4